MLLVAVPVWCNQPYVTSLYGAWVPPTSDEPRCSAKGCRKPATTDLSWRNPKLHDEARLKHWLACDEHADGLADFLSRRSFLLSRDPF
jgi:hypothetical protein